MNWPLLGLIAALGIAPLAMCAKPKPPAPAAVAPPIQHGLDAATIKIVDARASRVAHSQADTDEAANAIQAAPSAADPLPDDLRSVWLADIQRVRSDGDFTSLGSPNPDDVAQTMPPAGSSGR